VHNDLAHSHSFTLVDWLYSYVNDLSSKLNTFRSGIVHRLDKQTSGLLIVAKNPETYQKLK
jgi:23S rRNA pseudouridine1911/1915/1917 synthase